MVGECENCYHFKFCLAALASVTKQLNMKSMEHEIVERNVQTFLKSFILFQVVGGANLKLFNPVSRSSAVLVQCVPPVPWATVFLKVESPKKES